MAEKTLKELFEEALKALSCADPCDKCKGCEPPKEDQLKKAFEEYDKLKKQLELQKENTSPEEEDDSEEDYQDGDEPDIEVAIPCEGKDSKVAARYDKATKTMVVHLTTERVQDHGIVVKTESTTNIDFSKANIDTSTLSVEYDELGLVIVSADLVDDPEAGYIPVEMV